MGRLARWVTRHAAIITACAVALGMVAAVPLTQTWVDTSLAKYIDRGSERYGALKAHEARFDLSDPVVIVIRGEGSAMTPDRVDRLKLLHEQLEALPEVDRVWSLANAGFVHGSDDRLEIASLVGDPTLDARTLADREEVVRNRAIYDELLVSGDLRSAYILAFIQRKDDDPQRETRVVHQMYDIVDAYPGPERILFAGLPYHLVAISDTALGDLVLLAPVTILGLFILLAWTYRSPWSAILPLGAVGLITVLVIGAYAASGKALTEITSILPCLFAAIGVAYSMHLLDRYATSEGSVPSRTITALTSIAAPVTLSAVTTMIGFAALSVSGIPVIRDFALFAPLGIGCTYLAVVILLPALLCVAKPRLEPRRQADDPTMRLLRFAERTAYTRQAGVVIAIAVLTALATAGAARINVDNAFVEWLRPSHPARQYFDEIVSDGTGATPVYVDLDTGRADGATDPALLQQLGDFQTDIVQLPEVSSTLSLERFIDEMHRVAEGDATGPPSQALVSQYLLLYSSSEFATYLDRFVDFERRHLNISLRTTLTSSLDYKRVLSQVRERLDRFLPGVKADVIGTIALVFESTDSIATSQARSLAVALVAIGLTLMLALRSLRFGLIAFPSNVLPILVLFGVMGWFGIRLDMLSSIAACLTLGIIVDDSIHFIFCFRRAQDRGADPRSAIAEAFRIAGPPVIYTTIAVAGGFTALMLSGFTGIFNAGLLVVLSVTAALLTDLFLLPILLLKFGTSSVAT